MLRVDGCYGLAGGLTASFWSASIVFLCFEVLFVATFRSFVAVKMAAVFYFCCYLVTFNVSTITVSCCSSHMSVY